IAGEDAAVGLLGVQNRTPAEGAAIVNALASVPSAQYLARLNVAAGWSTHLTTDDVVGLVAQFASKVATMLPKELAEGGAKAIEALHAAGGDVGPIADPLIARVAAADATALTLIAPVAEALRLVAPAREPDLRA